MAKKLVSVVVSRPMKKPAKRINKRRKLKSALKKIFDYMKSDSYMFAPLIHPQSSLPLPTVSSGEVSMEKKDKKLAEDDDDYLKYDAYMYAPLVRDSAYEGTRDPSPESVRYEMERAGDDEERVRRRRIVVEHSLLQSER